jgi:PAT family beta-lactamase induction signal transducer AmpG
LQQLYLTNSTSLRMLGFSIFYFGQGVPIGLFTVAMPALLVAQGADASDVATLIAITGLPWAFKLIIGPFMDRFAFPAMGRRRPWVIAAQLGLTLSMLSLATVADPIAELQRVIIIGFIINSFAAFQDVAVDGMAIDVLPTDERGRANAFMAFGQVAGYSGFGALNGYLLSRYGLPVTALVSTLTVALILGFAGATREREGERLLPWTSGEAAPEKRKSADSFLAIFKDLIRVLFLPMSLLLVGVEILSRAAAGIYVSILPVVAVQELGYSAAQYAYWFGAMGGTAAVVGIFFGPLIDRHGAAKLLLVGLWGSAAITLLFALAIPLWSSDSFVITMLAASQILAQVFFISMIAMFMGVCWAKVAATQFAIYMSLANLGRSAGAGIFALIATDMSSTESMYLMAGLLALAGLLLRMFDAKAHRASIDALDASPAAAGLASQ